jgi:hypothetical protein
MKYCILAKYLLKTLNISLYILHNFANKKITILLIHPFCFMDTYCFYVQKLTIEESFEKLTHYYTTKKKKKGKSITIFNNSILGSGNEFNGW